MSRQSKEERKLDFLRAILECQIGSVKIDFAKLAIRLGYKNERCASDSYYRFCRENMVGRNRANDLNKRDTNISRHDRKQRFRANGKMIDGKGKGTNYNYGDDDEDVYDSPSGDDGRNDHEEVGGLKTEDVQMDGGVGEFWNLGIINLEPEEWGHGDSVKVKIEPGVKKEPVTETWVW